MIYGLLSVLSELKEGLGAVNELILVNGSFLPLTFFFYHGRLCYQDSCQANSTFLIFSHICLFLDPHDFRNTKTLTLEILFDFILEMIYILKYKDQA